MMKIGITANLLSNSQSYRNAGISMYIRHLLSGLQEVADNHEIIVYVSPGVDIPVAGDFHRAETKWPTEKPIVRIIWEQSVLPVSIALEGIDVLHSPMHALPVICTAPNVVTVLDLTFIKYPWTFPRLQRCYLENMTKYAVRKANAVIAISENTRRDVVETFGIPENKVFVTPLGVDESFYPRDEHEIARVRTLYELGEHTILYVGTLEPRKNLETLIRAFDRVRREERQLVLTLAGGRGWQESEIFKLVEKLGLGNAVIFTDYVDRKDLAALYSAAEVFVYPSLYEGFGLPPLEAMACGTPVITSNSSSLPEVVGDAGIMVSPYDEGELAEAILKVLRDTELRRNLHMKGLARAEKFSWKETAQRTLKVYEYAYGGNDRG